MKKTLVSLAAASLIVTSAMAADKGIDIVTTGQAVVYYETGSDNGKGDTSLFNQDNSVANVGVQLNLNADLKNNFTFGSQITYLGTAGLNRNLVGDTGVKQLGGSAPVTQEFGASKTTDDLALTKIFIAKKIGNTTVKIGRQELPKSLSPLAFTEGWNVFKNTFESILIVNSDIPNTTIVGAAVGASTKSAGNGLSEMSNLGVVTSTGKTQVAGSAYMLTVQNKSIPMTAITASYYNLSKVDGQAGSLVPNSDIGADAVWVDVKVAGKDLPMGLKVGLQAGSIMPESKLDTVKFANTTAFGAKIGLKPIDALTLCLAYTSVDGDKSKHNVAIVNTGGIKTPLYTQMVYNQDAISLDANTFMIKGVYNTGDYGKIIAQYAATSAGEKNRLNRNGEKTDYSEFDLIYKVKAGGIQYFAAWVNRSWSKVNSTIDKEDNQNKIRVWARYNF
ncbi:hypothetical protein [Sulfurimonas sp.]|uniref:hypothetical protein n=1 Tax=Sulfurimonas sp. TaxID=2022749 RepID=UPI002B485964|nr:hypothetical protein [Sulfurimonas sp.]